MNAPSAPKARTIGLWMAVALVMGNMIGSGIFLLPSSLAEYGGVGLLGWVVTAAGSLCLAFAFARLARLDPASGGPYAYTRLAFGDLAGFLVAWGYWVSCWCGNAAIAVAFVGYLQPFFPTVAGTPIYAALAATSSVWVLTAVNTRGIRDAGYVQVVTTVLKIAPLLLISAAAIVSFNPQALRFDPMTPRLFGSKLAAAGALTFWAFGGLESATIPAGSVRDPQRTIPRATIIGAVLTAIVYMLSTVGVMSVVPREALVRSTAPFADAARTFAGPWAATLVAFGAAIACFGALNGWILIAGQMPLAIARDRLFPKVFGRVSANGTPVAGLVISSVLTTLLIAMNFSRGLVDLFTFIILLGTLNALVPYAFSALAGFLIPEPAGRRITRGATLLAAGAFIYALFAIGGAGTEVVYWGFFVLLLGLPVYVWVKRA